jgi:hypothetical protein
MVTNRHLPDVQLVVEAASGALDIARRMMQREAEKKPCFGIFGDWEAWDAYKGLNEFASSPFPGIRPAFAMWPTNIIFAVPAKSPIKSYADGKGKRIGMGGPGSSPARCAQFLFDLHGVQKKDFKPYYFQYKETIEGMQDGSLDGGIFGGEYPVASVVELATRMPIRIVPVEPAMLKKIVAEHPYFMASVVKANAYKGITQDTPIMSFAAYFWTHAGVNNDLIYRIVKNLFEHREEFYAIHPGAKQITPETAARIGAIPFHPGAARYFKEIGVMKD